MIETVDAAIVVVEMIRTIRGDIEAVGSSMKCRRVLQR